MNKKRDPLIDECLGVYEAKNVKELSEIVDIGYTTLNKWEKDGPSILGKKILELLVENQTLKNYSKEIVKGNEAAIALKKLLNV